jgi:hypothetical protein
MFSSSARGSRETGGTRAAPLTSLSLARGSRATGGTSATGGTTTVTGGTTAGGMTTTARGSRHAADHGDRAHRLSYDGSFDNVLVSKTRAEGCLFLRKVNPSGTTII